MNDQKKSGFLQLPEVAVVVNAVVELLHPQSIYLYNQKTSLDGKLTSFKLCIVGEFADKGQAERELYLQIDSDIPFDVIFYTNEEWAQLCELKDSFARRIFTTGTVVYD